jgi:uncharacterized protein with HEPN domain
MQQRLFDVLRSCEAISQYTAGLEFADYERDSMVRDAVERRLGIIGEALTRAVAVDPALEDRVPELRAIVGLRNRIIHGYDVVADRIIWDIVQNELPLLRAQVQSLLNETGL